MGKKPLVVNFNKQGGEKQCLIINLKLLLAICKKKNRSAAVARRHTSVFRLAKREVKQQNGVPCFYDRGPGN